MAAERYSYKLGVRGAPLDCSRAPSRSPDESTHVQQLAWIGFREVPLVPAADLYQIAEVCRPCRKVSGDCVAEAQGIVLKTSEITPGYYISGLCMTSVGDSGVRQYAQYPDLQGKRLLVTGNFIDAAACACSPTHVRTAYGMLPLAIYIRM